MFDFMLICSGIFCPSVLSFHIRISDLWFLWGGCVWVFLFYSFFFPHLVCLFSEKSQKRCGVEWVGKWGGSGKNQGRVNHNYNILYKRKKGDGKDLEGLGKRKIVTSI